MASGANYSTIAVVSAFGNGGYVDSTASFVPKLRSDLHVNA
ncbi:hypothetical protein [Streptomyces sp. BK205]|nr:hypothetical protein [Streptomyces sp. BK205]